MSHLVFLSKNLYISTNNTDITEKLKIIVLKTKSNTKRTKPQLLNHYISDTGLKMLKNNLNQSIK